MQGQKQNVNLPTDMARMPYILSSVSPAPVHTWVTLPDPSVSLPSTGSTEVSLSKVDRMVVLGSNSMVGNT